MKPLALYIHIPFCRSKCIYCDFASWSGREGCREDYLNALRQELFGWKDALQGYEVSTLFIGGGTPSILPGEAIAGILADVKSVLPVRADAEITMEANPGATSPEQLRICRRAGVNRISFGAQSMNDALLKKLGRIHTVREVREAVTMARDAGFDNVSLDLMYALPGQTMELWLDTLEQAVALAPDHISAYSLIVEEGTPLYDQLRRGEIEVPDDDEAVEMQRAAIGLLERAGYYRYEISNYAREGRECRHNIVYWQRGEYLGLGCAAHSLMNGERFENPRELDAYLSGVRREERVKLTRVDAMEETLMLSTRMIRGMDLNAYKEQFGVDFESAHQKAIVGMVCHGLIEIEDGFLRLTQSGLEVQNAVVVELLDE